MDESIGQLASKAGFDSVVAGKAIGFVPGFFRSEGPSDKVEAPIASIQGVEAAIASAGSGFGMLTDNGTMAVGARPKGLGLGERLAMDEIQGNAHELFQFSRDKIGAYNMGDIIKGTPGPSQFA